MVSPRGVVIIEFVSIPVSMTPILTLCSLFVLCLNLLLFEERSILWCIGLQWESSELEYRSRVYFCEWVGLDLLQFVPIPSFF